MPTLTINGTEVTVERGTPLIEAAAQLGYEVPHFCYHPALSRPANCRMCLVEVEKAPKLMPACYTTVMDGMVVKTETDRVKRARKAVLEFILLNHPIDCPICDQAGECKLQDLYFEYSAQQSRLKTRKVHKVKVFPIGPEVVYDGERCILCTRCVRFCDEISKTSELTTVSRADMTEIRTFPGMELDNDYSQCTVDLCPVGALTSRTFRFKARVWWLETASGVCTGCSKGCSVHVDHFKNEVQRYRPRPNPEVNDYWMCDHGRATGANLHKDRLLAPISDKLVVAKNDALGAVANALDGNDAAQLGITLSPQLTSENLFAAIELGEKLGAGHYYVSGLPDDAFTLRNSDEVADDFLIQADKNPNRAALLRLAEAKGIALKPVEAIIDDANEGVLRAMIVVGDGVPLSGEPRMALGAAVKSLKGVVFVGAYDNTWARLADVSFPATTHVEEAGSFINSDGIVQRFDAALQPHGLSMPASEWLKKVARRLRAGVLFESAASLAADTAAALASDVSPEPEAAEEAVAP